jgi:AcrR family transcriptional regulator
MLEAGFDQLREKGLVEGLNALRLDVAIVMAGVPRAAAYREFKDQDNYRHEVLTYIVTGLPLGEGLAATAAEAERQFARHNGSLQSPDPEVKRRAVAEMIRVVAELNHSMLDGSTDWRVYRSIVTAAQTDPDLRDDMRSVIADGERKLLDGYTQFFQEMAARAGLRCRSEFEPIEFTLAVYALNDGLANRPDTVDRREVITLDHPSPGSSWTLFGIGFEALVDRFYEPI